MNREGNSKSSFASGQDCSKCLKNRQNKNYSRTGQDWSDLIQKQMVIISLQKGEINPDLIQKVWDSLGDESFSRI